MKLSIRARLAVLFTLIFAVLLILFTGVVYYFLAKGLHSKLTEDSHHDMGVLVYDLQHEWKQELAELSDESDEFRLYIKVMDVDGRLIKLGGKLQLEDWPTNPELIKSATLEPTMTDVVILDEPYLLMTQRIEVPGYGTAIVQTANTEVDLNWILERFIYCVNIGTPLVLILAGFAGYLFSRRALTPVLRITERAQKIGSDNLHDRLVYNGPADELSLLTKTLNDLLGRVQKTVNQMKQFIADASHELRIPLTGMRGLLEVALRQDRSKEEYKQAIENAYHESERLSELVWDLLSLARADAGQMKLEESLVYVPSFLQNVFEEAENLNAEKKVTIRLGKTPECKLLFDETKVHQLLINLIENAIRYNKPQGEIFLSADLKKSTLEMSVKDTGLGVAPEDQAKIFERFYRVDKARSREAGGTGLGLSIARAIAEAHRGTLTVNSVLGQGSEFVLTLPLEL